MTFAIEWFEREKTIREADCLSIMSIGSNKISIKNRFEHMLDKMFACGDDDYGNNTLCYID